MCDGGNDSLRQTLFRCRSRELWPCEPSARPNESSGVMRSSYNGHGGNDHTVGQSQECEFKSQFDLSQTGTINPRISYSVKKHLNFTNSDPWYHSNFKSFQFRMLKSSQLFFFNNGFTLNKTADEKAREGKLCGADTMGYLSHLDVKTAVQSGTLSP